MAIRSELVIRCDGSDARGSVGANVGVGLERGGGSQFEGLVVRWSAREGGRVGAGRGAAGVASISKTFDGGSTSRYELIRLGGRGE